MKRGIFMKNIIRKTAAAVSALMLVQSFVSFPAAEAESLTVTDLNYTESTEIIPGYSDCGYSCGIWINAAPGKTWSADPSGISLLLIDIGAYSSGINKDGKDYDLDEAFFSSLEAVLKNARKNDSMVGIRLRYDSNGIENPEPETFEQVLAHIDQLGESGLLDKYEENIAYIESGLVGAWGEQWGGKYTSLQHKAQVLDRFLDITPQSISVSVRTPNTVREWLKTYCGIETTAKDMNYSISDPVLAEKASRIGLYNDGYMGSDSDLGTYSDRKGETEWIAKSALYGGEFSGNDEHRLKYSTWLPENAIPEMYLTNLSRINCNLWKTRTVSYEYSSKSEAQARLDEIKELYSKAGLSSYDYNGIITEKAGKWTASWKWIGYDDFTFDSELDRKLGVNCDNSAFYGTDVWQFIRTHIGYRYVLRKASVSQKLDPGNALKIDISVENTGFSEPPKNKEAEIILSNGISSVSCPAGIDINKWLSGEKTDEHIEINIPSNISGGKWDVYLRISEFNKDAAYDTALCTRFANNDLKYSEELGANYLGTVTVSGKEYTAPEAPTPVQPEGYFPSSPAVLKIDPSEKISFLDRSCTFKGDEHYGFTFLYKAEGIISPVQLGDWYLRFTDSGTGYSSAYTTYGLNTMNLKLTEDGYYALNIPFFSAVFNFPGAGTAGSMTLHELNINDSRNYWSSDTYTDIPDGNNIMITPVGFAEGSPEGYSVTFHMKDGDHCYEGSYGFSDKSHQKISNIKAASIDSLIDFDIEKEYSGDDGYYYKFAGFTTVEGNSSYMISSDHIAIGNIELYPMYEPDVSKTDFDCITMKLTDMTDSQGIRYTLDISNGTASVGCIAGNWENSTFCSASGTVIIPAYVESDGKKYRVTSVADKAFSTCTGITDIIVPSTITDTGSKPFYKNTSVSVYKNTASEKQLKDQGYTLNILENTSLKGDINSDGNVNSADLTVMIKYILSGYSKLDMKAADINNDGIVNILDLLYLKQILLR